MVLKIAIVIGTTRPGRKAEDVSRWALDIAGQRSDAVFELIDLGAYDLPHLDEAVPPSLGQYGQPHTHRWAKVVDSYDGFVFVTPEYNHSIPGVLKNALDYLYAEWNNKAAGIVSYGGVGGVRGAEQLRLILAELQIATVRAQVALSLITDFENFTTLHPGEHQAATLHSLLDQLVAWSGALRSIRKPDATVGAH
jgi:NAD(P)H-dependent FMN reductase